MAYELISALILAVVQGVTEWLPVSSSGHLVLAERILGYNGGLEFSVALHFGTLMAVFVYFGKEITDIFQDLLRARWKSEHARLGFLLIVATIPAAIVGYLFRDVFREIFSDLGIVALGFGVTGLFLLIASLDFGKRKEIKNMGFANAFLIGLSQIFALFPGISRSGATISSGLVLGLKEKEAIKFSFLMSIPVIFGANIIAIGNKTLEAELVWATIVSFLVGIITIHFLYKFVLTSRRNLRWFAVYALLLALMLGAYILI